MAIPNDLNEAIDFSDIEKKCVLQQVLHLDNRSISWCRYQVRLEDGFDHILVIDGVPVIDRSKLDKLLTKIAKEFTKKGAAIKPDDISLPWNDNTGKSNG